MKEFILDSLNEILVDMGSRNILVFPFPKSGKNVLIPNLCLFFNQHPGFFSGSETNTSQNQNASCFGWSKTPATQINQQHLSNIQNACCIPLCWLINQDP